MKKVLLFGTAALVMSATSAFAYTNEYAGFTINNKKPDCVMESAKMYGYMNLTDKNVHTVSFFNEQDMEAVLGNKFTTATFDESYNKLAVLDKNDLDKSILNLPILDFKRYADLDETNKAALEANLKNLKEKLKPEIRLDKIGGKKIITLNLLHKRNNELINTDLSFLSANNRMYLLASGGMAELVSKESEKEAAKEKSLLPTKEKDKNKIEAVDRSTVDPAVLAKFWKSHSTYVKAFKVLPTVKADEPVVAYEDFVLGKKIQLPKDWGYFQYNHNDKKNPGSISIALPTKTFINMGAKLVDKKVTDTMTGTIDQKTTANLSAEALDCVEQIFASGTVKVDKDKDVADMLANPLVTKLQADLFFKEGLKRLKSFGNAYIKVNDYKYSSAFSVNKGAVDVLLDVTVLEKYDFLNNIKLSGTDEKASGLILLTKKGITPDAGLKKIYDIW